MARLPDPYERRPVGSGVRPVATIRNAGALGAAVADMGRGVQSLGSDLDRVFERQRQEEAAAAAADGEVAASARIRERLYDPESGFLNMSGSAAVHGRAAVLHDMDGLLDESLKGLDPEAAKRLRPVLIDKIEMAKRQIDIHTSTQRTVWLNSASEARVKNAAADAVTRYGSPEAVDDHIGVAVAELRNRAEREGWPSERLEMEVEGTTAKVIRDVAVRMANAGDPMQAMEFARANADRLGPEMAYIEQVVLPEAKKQQGRNIADEAMAGGLGGMAPPSLVLSESGGDFGARNDAVGASGRRGHFGRGQFGHDRLDDARRAGVIPENMTADQFLNDKGAQLRVESWHFADIQNQIDEKGLDQFIGKEVGGVAITRDGIVAMAHLGGFNGARRFLETGGLYDPADDNGTRLSHYAKKHAGDTTGPLGRSGKDPVSVALAIADPDVRDAALSRIVQVQRAEAVQEAARRSAAQQQMFTEVEAGVDPRTLPLEMREAAGIDAVRAMENYYDQKSSGFAIRTDPELFAELMKEAHGNPAAFASRELLTYRDKLSEQDYRALTETKAKIDAGESVAGVSFDHAQRVWRSAGIEDGVAGSELGRRYAGLEVEFTREWQRFVEREKRQPTLTEQSEIAGRVAMGSGLAGSAQQLSRETVVTSSASELRSAAEPILRAAELWQPKGESDRQTAAGFHSAHQREAQRFVERIGRQPTSVEAAQMAERMLQTFTVNPSGVMNETEKHAFEITLDDLEAVRLGETTLAYDGREITLAEIQMAGRVLRHQGNADPTIPELLELIAGE